MADDMMHKRLRELALRAVHTGRTQFTRFLEPSMIAEVRRTAHECGAQCTLWGGYPDAERCIAAYHDEDAPENSDFPLRAIRIDWNAKFAHPGHRDLLGAVMGLGIERDAAGDIAMGTNGDAPCAWLFVTEEMADYIAASLESAGRATIRTCVTDEQPSIDPPQGSERRVTVQSERLDAVLSAGFDLSRSEAQRLITSGLVKRNHVPELHTDARVTEGDLLSARGHGRLLIRSFAGVSRRGRLVLTLFRYGS